MYLIRSLLFVLPLDHVSSLSSFVQVGLLIFNPAIASAGRSFTRVHATGHFFRATLGGHRAFEAIPYKSVAEINAVVVAAMAVFLVHNFRTTESSFRAVSNKKVKKNTRTKMS